MLEEFSEVLKDNVTTPASDKVFDVDESPKLEARRAELLHMFVAMALFIAKRGRLDIQVPVHSFVQGCRSQQNKIGIS